MITAYLEFHAENPICTNIAMHPATTPQEELQSHDAAGYFDALSAHATLEEAKASIEDHVEASKHALAQGYIEDLDEEEFVAHKVNIHDDGRIEVFDDEDNLMAEITVKEAYETFGMTMPA